MSPRLTAHRGVTLRQRRLLNKWRSSVDRSQRWDRTEKRNHKRDLGSSSRLVEVRRLKRNFLLLGILFSPPCSCRLRRNACRRPCKQVAGVAPRQPATVGDSRACFPSQVHACFCWRGTSTIVRNKTLQLRENPELTDKLVHLCSSCKGGWLEDPDLDVWHSCSLANTPPWTCVFSSAGLHCEYL